MMLYQYLRVRNAKLLLWLSLAFGLIGCQESQQKEQLHIVATTSILGDAVRQIVQNKATVTVLMGPMIDPHVYKASPKDVQALLSADVIVSNGLHLEGKMTGVLENMRATKRVYFAGDAIKDQQLLKDPNFPTGIDPHIWFDVRLWQQVVQYISEQLQAADKANAAFYQKNTTQYLAQLATLHQTTLEAVDQIPRIPRVLITAHDAFEYFGRAYQMEVRGLQGISTAAECGLRDITNLVDFIIKRKIKAIFPETSVPDRALKAVLEGCKQKGHEVVLGGYLYSDALGPSDSKAATYQGMVQANVETIVNALK